MEAEPERDGRCVPVCAVHACSIGDHGYAVPVAVQDLSTRQAWFFKSSCLAFSAVLESQWNATLDMASTTVRERCHTIRQQCCVRRRSCPKMFMLTLLNNTGTKQKQDVKDDEMCLLAAYAHSLPLPYVYTTLPSPPRNSSLVAGLSCSASPLDCGSASRLGRPRGAAICGELLLR